MTVFFFLFCFVFVFGNCMHCDVQPDMYADFQDVVKKITRQRMIVLWRNMFCGGLLVRRVCG